MPFLHAEQSWLRFLNVGIRNLARSSRYSGDCGFVLSRLDGALDHLPVEIQPVSHRFRGNALSMGHHLVERSFVLRHFKLAADVPCSTWSVGAVWLILCSRQEGIHVHGKNCETLDREVKCG